MDLSGIIFVALAVAWVAYLVPKALKHHDEVARTRSIDRFSTAMRVLARREPVSGRDARLVVAPPRPADNPRVVLPSSQPVAAVDRPVAPRPAAQRAAARAAAGRRRRILALLLLADLVVGLLAAFAVAPWWAPVVPVALTVLFLVLARTQVRRARNAVWDRELAASADEAPRVRRAARVEAQDGMVRTLEVDELEDTVDFAAPLVDAVAVATDDGGSLWDPLPMTLPTYVTKPKARRTVRTIDLNEPDTWTSGHSQEDSRLVAESAAQAAEGEAEELEIEQQRAVGS